MTNEEMVVFKTRLEEAESLAEEVKFFEENIKVN